MNKEPKRYECTECGFISNRIKSLKFTGVSFAICFKCRGRIKERQEWLNWLDESRERIRQEAIKNSNGYIMGVDVMTKAEREGGIA